MSPRRGLECGVTAAVDVDVAVDWNRVFEIAWRVLVFIVAIAIIVIVSGNWTRWEGGVGWQRTNDAYIQADLTPISAKVAGFLRELPIQDFQRVHKGQVLAQLVDDDYRAAVAEAQANIAAATAQAQALRAQHALQLANVQAAQATVSSILALQEQNVRDLTRQERLLRTGSSSTEASEKLETARAQLTAQRAEPGTGPGCAARARGARRLTGVSWRSCRGLTPPIRPRSSEPTCACTPAAGRSVERCSMR